MKWLAWMVLLILPGCLAHAGEKGLQGPFAHDVVEARWVAVVSYTGSQVPVESPQENQRAVQDVQTALAKWGRYKVTPDPTAADLIIAVRKGRAQATTINGTSNPTPVILDPGDSGVTIGIHRGQAPPLSRGDTPPAGASHPRVGTQVGPAEDLFEVYRGRTEYPLDNPPVFQYRAKNGLQAPKVEAVAKFRKAVEEAEKKKP